MARYRVLELLGQGGMGVVYRAIQVNLDREVAIKFLLMAGDAKHRLVARFQREVKALTRVCHPNVIKVLDHGEIDGQLFYAMEYVRGRTLRRRMDETGPLPARQVVSIARQLLEALVCVHRAGLIHRDIKPANVILGDSDHVTLMDFGLAKDLEATVITGDGAILGTPSYLPPEAILSRPLDARSDLFSLGVVLYEAAAGALPFGEPGYAERLAAIVKKPHRPLGDCRPELPAWLVAFIDTLLAKASGDRFGSASAALRALRLGLGEVVEDDEPEPEQAELTDDPSGPPTPLPQASIEGGLDVLRAHATARARARPGTPAATAPTPARVALPGTATPGQPQPGVGRLAIAGLAIAFLVLAVVHGAANRQPAAPAVDSSTASPRPLAPERACAAALAGALRRFDPESQIRLVRSDLEKVPRSKWFSTPPHPGMAALRSRWGPRLVELARSSGLEDGLGRFLGHVERFFTGPGPTPDERLDLYLLLHELVSLRLYCRRFGIPLSIDPSGALSASYGQSPASRLGDDPAVCLDFVPTVEHAGWARSADAALPGNWSHFAVSTSERFHTAGDPQDDDLFTTAMDSNKDLLEYRHPEPLPIPPLPGLEALEVGAFVSDLHACGLFVVSLSCDGRTYRRVAVLRDEYAEPPRAYWHAVDPGCLQGEALFIKVNLVVLPGMDAHNEYSLMPRLIVKFRPRVRPRHSPSGSGS